MSLVRVLAIFESTNISGPAKNLLQFAKTVGSHIVGCEPFQPRIDLQVAVFWRPQDSPVFVDAARAAGIQVHKIPEAKRFDRSVLPAMRDLAASSSPHILQTHGVKGHFLARYSGLHRNLPWIAFHHGYTDRDLRNRVYNQFDRWSLLKADHVVTMNEPFRRELVRTGVASQRISIIHNAIDPTWGTRIPLAEAAALRQSLGIPPERQVILIAARLSKEKDHETLLRAVRDLVGIPGLDPHLVIAGDGPERSQVEATIANLDLSSRVTITGWVPSAEPYYRMASAAVLSSRSEGSPNALLEGFCAGTPMVATRVGGIPEIATDQKSALLVEPGDRAQMKTALQAILSNPERSSELVENAKQSILTKYVPEIRARSIVALYQQLIQGKEVV